MLDVYPARERAEDFPGVTGRLVAAAAADSAGGRRVAWLPGFDEAERFLRAELRDGDLLLTLGRRERRRARAAAREPSDAAAGARSLNRLRPSRRRGSTALTSG